MSRPSVILGVNLYHGDASAALIVDGQLVGAIEEERFNRVKHCAGVPYLAIEALLCENALTLEQVDRIAVGRKGSAHLARKAMYVLTRAPHLRKNVFDKIRIRRQALSLPEQLAARFGGSAELIRKKMVAVEHHLAHLASAYHFSAYDRAVAISIDGFGDFVSTMWALCDGDRIQPWQAVYFPHSLGILYQAVTQYIGFPHYGDEGKVMGLAPYGEPRYEDEFRQLIRPASEGRFVLNPLFFRHAREGIETDFSAGAPRIGPLYSTTAWERVFDRPPQPVEATCGDPPDSWICDMAATVQAVVEKHVFRVVRSGWEKRRDNQLCLAGGVALNSVANGKISERVPFQDIYIHPAAGDDGIAAGAAAWVWRSSGGGKLPPMRVPYTGSAFDKDAVLAMIQTSGLKPDGRWRKVEIDEHGVKCRCRWIEDDSQLYRETAAAIADGEVVGWFQGRMEFGPRALGHRSILADPRRNDTKDILNQRIKHRERFRPFAPSVLEEETGNWFEKTLPSPAMLMVYKVRAEKRAQVPAITHVDGTGRLQTVRDNDAPRYAALIRAFAELTGVPMVLNTSFNENEPIVRTPAEALACFARTRIDRLVMENLVLTRERKKDIDGKH